MNRNSLSQRRCWFVILLALVTCVPASAQYTDGLGGNWNNPASAMITNIIMDRYARRRLEKNLAAKRSGASRAAAPSSSDSTARAAKLNDASVRFRSTGTQLKTREIANLIDAGNPQVLALMTAILTEYEKNARAAGRPDDLALALSFFLATNASVYHDAGQPTDSQMLELRDTIAQALVEGNALNGVTDRQKQEMYEALVLYTGFALAAYQEGKQGGNAESVRAGQQLAGQNLLAVTGISPDKINFNDQGLSIETEAAAANAPAAAPAESADAPPQSGNAGTIDYMELSRQYDSNEVAADANYKGKRIRVSGPFAKAEIEGGKVLVWFWQTGYNVRIGCYFEDSQRASVAQLKDRQTIVVEGTMRGHISAGRVMMDGCVLR
jgi:tRNA_anti-like